MTKRIPGHSNIVIARSFDKIHDQLSVVRNRVLAMNDATAVELWDQLEVKSLAAMRKLRLYLGVPYTTHDAIELDSSDPGVSGASPNPPEGS